jgi:uncharacterized membrane protein
MSVLSASVSENRNSRLLLLVSLALNLFFVGAIGTLLVRHYLAPPATVPIDRSVAARIERLAATLPPSDADILRAEFRSDKAPVEAVEALYRQALQELIAAAAGKMSKSGREKIADWPPRQRNANETNR